MVLEVDSRYLVDTSESRWDHLYESVSNSVQGRSCSDFEETSHQCGLNKTSSALLVTFSEAMYDKDMISYLFRPCPSDYMEEEAS